MNIPKAIEIKQQFQYKLQDPFMPELIEADNLSIEALKRLSKARQQYSGWSARPLPGETEN